MFVYNLMLKPCILFCFVCLFIISLFHIRHPTLAKFPLKGFTQKLVLQGLPHLSVFFFRGASVPMLYVGYIEGLEETVAVAAAGCSRYNLIHLALSMEWFTVSGQAVSPSRCCPPSLLSTRLTSAGRVLYTRPWPVPYSHLNGRFHRLQCPRNSKPRRNTRQIIVHNAASTRPQHTLAPAFNHAV